MCLFLFLALSVSLFVSCSVGQSVCLFLGLSCRSVCLPVHSCIQILATIILYCRIGSLVDMDAAMAQWNMDVSGYEPFLGTRERKLR